MRASKITRVDFFDDLTSSYARKRFFASFSIVIAVCLLLILLIGGLSKDIFVSVLIEIFVGALIIISFYGLYVYFIGENTALYHVNVIRPQDIKERMSVMPKNVRHYMFWGRSGSFFRAYPLMELDKQARENKRNIVVEVLLPDPSDDRLVRSYQDILKALGEIKEAKKGITQKESLIDNSLLPNVLATCMACAILSSNNKHLEIKVHLSRFLPAFRLDLSDNGAVLTQDDKKKSALFFDHGTEFYDMFRSAVASERDISREVKWDKSLFIGCSLSAESCNAENIKAFDIQFDDVTAMQNEVARLITERPHRYR